METFESARIQTAARAIGVAQNGAWKPRLSYANETASPVRQIALINFPRVCLTRLAMMAVEIMIARQLTYHSAREKDEGRRCDLEAGMAKLLGARVAWAATPTPACKSTAATASRWNTRSAGFCVTRASSTSSRALPRFRHKSSPGGCWKPEKTRRPYAPNHYTMPQIR